MGNMLLRCSQGAYKKKLVTVLRKDGRVLEFDRQFRVSQLLADFPGHFVCKSEDLAQSQSAKGLPPNTLLQRGKIYLMLPLNRNSCRRSPMTCKRQRAKINPIALDAAVSEAAEETEQDPAAGDHEDQEPDDFQSFSGQTIKLVISKKQLAKILASGSIQIAPFTVNNAPMINTVRNKGTWSPELDSIAEVQSREERSISFSMSRSPIDG